jgi:hypothetical protein
MEDEVVIVEVKPKMFDVRNESGHCTFRLCYKKEFYDVNQPITHKPEYLAIRDPGGFVIEMLFMIDQAKSTFEKGLIVPQDKPIRVSIPLRTNNETSTNHKIWYTSFRTLLTHSTTDEFTIESSKPISSLISTDGRILCNGYCCNHFSYCKFFNHSEGPVLKSSTLPQ